MIRRWLRSPRAKRGLAAGIVVLATGGLVLARAPAITSSSTFGVALGKNGTSFSGPGAHGTLALSQTKVLASSGQTVFAELRLKADESRSVDEARAPLSLAIGSVRPDLVFWLNLDPAEAQRRRSVDGRAEDRIESRGLDYMQKVHNGFQQLVGSGELIELNAKLPESELAAAVWQRVEKII